MNNPKVSVITTVYNGEKYITRAIPSILCQTHQDFEFIIVDDGSTDQTLTFLREVECHDSRVRVFSPGRLGRSQALNYAIQHAEGEYIANQDFDDVSQPTRLELQKKFLDDHPNVGLLGGAYLLVDDERGEKHVRTPACENLELIHTMAKCVPFAHTISIFRKKTWEDVGGYPLVDNLVDLRFWLKIAASNWEIASIPNVLGEHWVHSDSYWHRNFKYLDRQRDLASVQWQVISTLGLPTWYAVYPAGRYIYSYLPNRFKLYVRRSLLNIREKAV